MISVQYDEICPFCKEEIVLELENHAVDGEIYNCECGAAIEIEYGARLNITASKNRHKLENKEEKE